MADTVMMMMMMMMIMVVLVVRKLMLMKKTTTTTMACLVIFSLFALHFSTAANEQTPTILWSQKFGTWSKFRALIGQTDNWANQSALRYAHTQPKNKASYWSVDYNPRNDVIYWSDESQPSFIYRQVSKNSFQWLDEGLDIYNLTRHRVYVNELAVDWMTGNIYFIDNYNEVISLYKDPTVKVIHIDDVTHPIEMCLDSTNGFMFWLDTIANEGLFKIEKSNLFGGNRSIINTSPISRRLSAITTYLSGRGDDGNEEVFIVWIEDVGRRVMFSDANGRDVREMYRFGEDKIYRGIGAFQNNLFLADQSRLTVEMIDMKSGQLLNAIEIDALPTDLIVMHTLDKDIRHECDDKLCTDFCLNVGHLKGRCACRDGYYLALDGVSCEASRSIIIFATDDNLMLAIPNTNIPHPYMFKLNLSISLTSLASIDETPFGMDTSFKDKRLFWTDTSTGSIFVISVNQNNSTGRSDGEEEDDDGDGDVRIEEITSQHESLKGFATNWIDESVYWMDSRSEYLMTSEFDGSYHSIVYGGFKSGRGLVVDPYQGILYWSQLNGTSQKRQLCKLQFNNNNNINNNNNNYNNNNYNYNNYDNYNYDVICFLTLKQETIDDLVLDVRQQRLFWSDPSANKIWWVELKSGIVQSLDLKSNVNRFTIIEDIIVLTQTTSSSSSSSPVKFVKIPSSSSLSSLSSSSSSSSFVPEISGSLENRRLNMSNKSGAVTMFGNYLQPINAEHTPCVTNDHKCDQLCVTITNGYTCRCAIGYIKTGNKCETDILQEPAIYFLDTFHKQIYQITVSSSSPPPSSSSSSSSLSSPLISSLSLSSNNNNNNSNINNINNNNNNNDNDGDDGDNIFNKLSTIHSFPHSSLIHPTQFQVDDVRGVIYILDLGQIKAFRLADRKMELIDLTNTKEGSNMQISQIGLDIGANELFMTDVLAGKLMVLYLANRTVDVVMDKLDHPFAVQVDSSNRMLYWTESGKLKRITLRSLATAATTATTAAAEASSSSSKYDVTVWNCCSNITSIFLKDDVAYLADIEGHSIVLINTTISNNNSNNYNYNNNNNNNDNNNNNTSFETFYFLNGTKFNSITSDGIYIYFAASNKRSVYRVPINRTSSSSSSTASSSSSDIHPVDVHSIAPSIFSRISQVIYVAKLGRSEQTPNNNNTLYLILGLTLGLLLLLLLCLLCLILALIFWKRKKKRQKVDPNNKETVIQPNNKDTIIPTISSTTLPTLTQSGKFAVNHGYVEDDGHLFDDSLTNVLYEYMFLPNDSVQSPKNKSSVVSRPQPPLPVSSSSSSSSSPSPPPLPSSSSPSSSSSSSSSSSPPTTSSLSVSTSDSSSPLQPVAASLSAPQPTKSSSSSSSKLNSDNKITCPPHNNNDASKLEKNDFEMTPTPPGSSSSRSDRSLSGQSAPGDDVITSLSSSANLLAVGPERGGKAGPIGRNILMSPPKLHTQPRGFAPASHNVPAAVKNTWGRSKIKDSKSFKATKELDISDNDGGSKLKESKSFKITKDRDGEGSNDGGSSFSGNLLY